jgi:hypothetical protein
MDVVERPAERRARCACETMSVMQGPASGDIRPGRSPASDAERWRAVGCRCRARRAGTRRTGFGDAGNADEKPNLLQSPTIKISTLPREPVHSTVSYIQTTRSQRFSTALP